jgi:hypothetical protein
MVHSADTLQNLIIVTKYSLKYPKACHVLEKLEMDTNIFSKRIKGYRLEYLNIHTSIIL